MSTLADAVRNVLVGFGSGAFAAGVDLPAGYVTAAPVVGAAS